MTDLLTRQYGTVNGSVNWSAGPAPVSAFLQGYSVNDIYVMNAMPAWAGVKVQLGVTTLSGTASIGIKTDFSSTFEPYFTDSIRFGNSGISAGGTVSSSSDSFSVKYAIPGLMRSPFLSLGDNGQVWIGVQQNLGDPRGDFGLRGEVSVNVTGGPPLGDTPTGKAWVTVDPSTLAPVYAGTSTYRDGTNYGHYAGGGGVQSYQVGVDAYTRAINSVYPGWNARSDTPDSGNSGSGVFRGVIDWAYSKFYVPWGFPAMSPVTSGDGTPFSIGASRITFLDPTNPLAANGVMQDYSIINGMLLNTQNGQIAFGSPDGLTGTSADWVGYFGNNNIGSLNFDGLNQTAWSSWYSRYYVPSSSDYSFDFGFSPSAFDYIQPGFTYETAPTSALPVILDLTGAGINITELGSSGQYVDMTGGGYQNRTAWAGAGNGVLVFDVNGNGIVDSSNEFEFTAWDPTATSDMQALRDVFDTNHNGQLDAGDTSFAAFKVLVTNADGTTTLMTLAELGIVSINLTTDNSRTVLADGSVIAGQTVFARADGSTGAAADVSLAYDAYGYATQQTVTLNADGSTTIDVKAINPDGSLAGETVTTTSADGLSRVVKFDHSGSGIFDQTQTIVSAVNADGSRTRTTSNFDVTGALRDRTVTTTSLNGQTVTIARDLDGNGQTDQTELRVTNADGSRTITVTDLNADGSVRDRSVSSTGQDGLRPRQPFGTGLWLHPACRRTRQSGKRPRGSRRRCRDPAAVAMAGRRATVHGVVFDTFGLRPPPARKPAPGNDGHRSPKPVSPYMASRQ